MAADVHTQRFATVFGPGRGSAAAQAQRDDQERSARLARIEAGFARFERLDPGGQEIVRLLRVAHPDAVKARESVARYLADKPYYTTVLWLLVAAGDPPTHPGLTAPVASVINREFAAAQDPTPRARRFGMARRTPTVDPQRRWRAISLAHTVLNDLEDHGEYSDAAANQEAWERARPLLDTLAVLLEQAPTTDGAGMMPIVGARLMRQLATDPDLPDTILSGPAAPLAQAFARRLVAGRASGDERKHLKQAGL